MCPLSSSDGLFTNAVKRIWTKRIGMLKDSGSGLVTQELLEWETDVKMAVEDPDVYQWTRETNIKWCTAVSFLNQLVKEQWVLLGSSTLESVAQRRFLKRKAENNVEGDESRRRLESDIIDHASERRGSGEGEDGNGNGNGNGNDKDVEGVGCLENDEIDKVNEQYADKEHEPSLDKGDKTAAE